jgi:hypothetical protein
MPCPALPIPVQVAAELTALTLAAVESGTREPDVTARTRRPAGPIGEHLREAPPRIARTNPSRRCRTNPGQLRQHTTRPNPSLPARPRQGRRQK